MSKMKTDPIVESVVRKLQERSKVGIKKYGTTLYENNSDDFLVHLQEELMDAVNYIEKELQVRRDGTQLKMFPSNKIKCPKCGDEGHKYFDVYDQRNWFQCDGRCRYHCLLKELNTK